MRNLNALSAGPDQREKEEGEEEAAGGEGSPGEGQGGGHQQTDAGNGTKTQGYKDRAVAILAKVKNECKIEFIDHGHGRMHA